MVKRKGSQRSLGCGSKTSQVHRAARFYLALCIALVPLMVVALIPTTRMNVLWAFVCTGLLLIQVWRQANG